MHDGGMQVQMQQLCDLRRRDENQPPSLHNAVTGRHQAVHRNHGGTTDQGKEHSSRQIKSESSSRSKREGISGNRTTDASSLPVTYG